jgi:hypothetical protein
MLHTAHCAPHLMLHTAHCAPHLMLHIAHCAPLVGAEHKTHVKVYTGCPGRNVPDFGRMFLKLKYTDLTKNTYILSWTATEIMVREKCGLLAVPHTVPGLRDVLPVHCTCSSFSLQPAQAISHCDCTCKVLQTLRTTATLVSVFV